MERVPSDQPNHSKTITVNEGQRQGQLRNLVVARLCFEHVKVYVAQSSTHGDIGTPGDQSRNLNLVATTPRI